jgi:hypothetical protein
MKHSRRTKLHTITPKLKLSEAARNVVLSRILNDLHWGMICAMMSRLMKHAPKAAAGSQQLNCISAEVETKSFGNEPHARPLTQASIHPRESFEIMLKFVGSYCSRGGQRGEVPCDRLRG